MWSIVRTQYKSTVDGLGWDTVGQLNQYTVASKLSIAGRQYEVVRVADAAIDIYAMAATLSRYGGVW